MAERGTYRTKQRELVDACLATHQSTYLTVDEVWAAVTADGGSVGRTTVYRNLEAMVAAGSAVKATSPTGEARYRKAPDCTAGQLMCLICGHAYPLDCHMLDGFATHVLDNHGFEIENARTVLYGTCAACKADEGGAHA